MASVTQLQRRMLCYQPRLRWSRRWRRRSAVAMVLRDGQRGLEVLMIQRAECEGDPWSGQMAFPGGHQDPEDRHGFDAACRETLEEVGLDLRTHGQSMGRLSDIPVQRRMVRRGMVISPFLFAVDTVPPLRPNYEVADVLWIPLPFLADAGNRQSMRWETAGFKLTLPCYWYEGQRIWGLSLMMLDELLALLRGEFDRA